MIHKALETTAHLPNNSNAPRSVNKVQLATKLVSASEMHRHAWPCAQAAELFCMSPRRTARARGKGRQLSSRRTADASNKDGLSEMLTGVVNRVRFLLPSASHAHVRQSEENNAAVSALACVCVLEAVTLAF